MKMSLTDFKTAFQDVMLDLLWRQWTAVGILGHGPVWQSAPIDPEALLLISATVARHDARLFDAMLEWLRANGRYVNIQRIKRLLVQDGFTGESVWATLADLTNDSASSAKWTRSANSHSPSSGKSVPLFYLKDGRPLPVVGELDPVFADHGLLRTRFEPRGVAQSFRPEPVPNLILRLRAFLGVNARCEIIAFLLLNRRGSPRAIARDCGYYSATVSKALVEMGESGFVIFRVEGRHRYYTLIPDTWRKLLIGDASPAWLVWPRLFSALEQIWLFLWRDDLDRMPPLAQASALRRVLLNKTIEKMNGMGLDFTFGDVSAYSGEAIIPFFIDRMTVLFESLGAAEQHPLKILPKTTHPEAGQLAPEA